MPPLIRTLTQRDLFLLFVGSVIGSGIFLTPGLIFRQLDGSVGFALLVWIVGGVSLFSVHSPTPNSRRAIPKAAVYCYIRDGFGRLPAFLYGWCLFAVIASGTIAALARAFTRYLTEIIPLSAIGATIVSLVMIAVITAVNVWGTEEFESAKLDHAHQRGPCSAAQRRSAFAGHTCVRRTAGARHQATWLPSIF